MSAMGGKLPFDQAEALPDIHRMDQFARICLPLLTVASSCVASCGLDKSDAALDAHQIYGCYTAPGAPWFTLTASGMRVEGSSATVPFHYDGMKVGAVIVVRLDATHSRENFTFVPSAEESFYRRVPFSDPPVIIVPFGPDGEVVNYSRSDEERCRV